MIDGTASEVRHVWDGMNADEGSYNAIMHSIRDKCRGIRFELVMVAFRLVDAMAKKMRRLAGGARPACS